MPFQDDRMRSRISLGNHVDPQPRKIPSTGEPDGGNGKLKKKISLSAPVDDESPNEDYRSEDDYRAEDNYRNAGKPQPMADSAETGNTGLYASLGDRVRQYSDEHELMNDSQYQDDLIPPDVHASYDPQAAKQGYRDASDVADRRRKLYRRASIVFLGVFIVSGTLLALMLGTNWLKDKAYADLSSDVAIEMKDGTTQASSMETQQAPTGRNWAELRAENPDIKYWMNVEHKPIDYPLVQHPTDQNYYLKHNFWGDYSTAGTPFIDIRNYAMTDKHLLTYGHHITGSETMYSTVNKAWKPEKLAEIGKLTLEFPDANDTTNYEIFYPAFAFMVDQSYQTIQEFEFADDAAFRLWLRGMADEASATNEYTDYLVRNARRSVSFITCASDTPNQRERTIIMFISVAAPSTSYELANFLPQDVAELTAQATQQQAQATVTDATATAAAPVAGTADTVVNGQTTIGNPQIATRLNPMASIAKEVADIAGAGRVVPDSPLLTGKPWR